MNLNDYQDKVMSFRLPTADYEYALLGLVGEVGELFSLLAKAVRDGTDARVVDDGIKKELGDILWFIAAIAKDEGFSLEEIAQANYDKLASRAAHNVLTGSGDNR